MISWKYYPINKKIPNTLHAVVKIFEKHETEITSENHTLSSNSVLGIITSSLLELNFQVETSKKNEDKIRVPVTYKERGDVDLSFETDAYHVDNKTVLEVEAGRGVTNYQFLKDLFQSCMMADVEYLSLAVRKIYRSSADFKKVLSFFDALYASNRLMLPLKGVLVIGY